MVYRKYGVVLAVEDSVLDAMSEKRLQDMDEQLCDLGLAQAIETFANSLIGTRVALAQVTARVDLED